MARDVTVHAFVRAPYDQYVHDKTVFWNASGASLQLGGNGVRLQLESLRAVVLGGLGFGHRPRRPSIRLPRREDHQFVLFTLDRDARRSRELRSQPSLRQLFQRHLSPGLTAGSPVVLHGLQIGMVNDVAFALRSWWRIG